MAVYSTFSTDRPMIFGRSGYNSKPTSGDDDDNKNSGRSGYNQKPNTDDDDNKNHARSGYNTAPKTDDEEEKKK